MTDSLTTTEQQQLAALEATIQDGLREFQRTGAALAEIRDQRLYRAGHATFDDYLQARWGITRQHAGRLISAAEVAQVLEPVGYTPANENQARQPETKAAAKLIQDLEPEQVATVAKFIQATTGSEKPSTSQIKAVAEVVAAIDQSGTVEHPDTGEQVPFTALPEPARMAVIRENVSTSTHERMQRQQQHIQTSVQASGKGGWTDWGLNYVKEQRGHRIVITLEADESGNPQAVAAIHNRETGSQLATGEHAPYMKKAVLSLVEEVKG